MHIIHNGAVDTQGAAYGIKSIGICDLVYVNDLVRISLSLSGKHSSHKGTVYLYLIGNQISYLALATG